MFQKCFSPLSHRIEFRNFMVKRKKIKIINKQHKVRDSINRKICLEVRRILLLLNAEVVS